MITTWSMDKQRLINIIHQYHYHIPACARVAGIKLFIKRVL
jgi:hypothetical protein